MQAVIVIPVFNEAATLVPLTEKIVAFMPLRPFRILFVDDGSTDDSFNVILKLRERFPEVNYIRFSRNAGKTQALASAFARTIADVVVTMDADLQDDPAELPRLLGALGNKDGVVCGWKQNRRDPWHKTMPSKIFNAWMALLFGLPLHDMNTGFKAIRGQAARGITLTGDRHRFVPVLVARLGYSAREVPVVHHPRKHGHSKYGFERYFQGIRDAITLWLEARGLRQEPVYTGEPDGLVSDVRIDTGFR